MKTLLVIFALLYCSISLASEPELHIGKFSAGDLTGWKEQTIGFMKPKTSYSFVKDNDRMVLAAHSNKSASGRIFTVNLDPKEYSTLKWSWKIDHTIKKGDEKTKDGEDFAARVYVVFPRGFFSKTRAISYVWANRLSKGEHVASPFTPNIITVAVDSGEELAGHWTFHQRNIYEDYKVFFGEEPPKIGAIALMTDTDNTGESTIGYYGDIYLIRSAKASDTKQKEKIKEPLSKDTKQNKLPQPAAEQTTNETGVPQTAPKTEEGKPVEQKRKEQPNGAVIPTPPAAQKPPISP